MRFTWTSNSMPGDNIDRAMKKGTTVARIREHVGLIRRHGLAVAGFFILGYPGETLATIRNTIRFAMELDIQRAQFMTFVPLPGTRVPRGYRRSTRERQLPNPGRAGPTSTEGRRAGVSASADLLPQSLGHRG